MRGDKKLTYHQQQHQLDMEVTEYWYFKFRSPQAKDAINKLRYVLIVNSHGEVSSK